MGFMQGVEFGVSLKGDVDMASGLRMRGLAFQDGLRSCGAEFHTLLQPETLNPPGSL